MLLGVEDTEAHLASLEKDVFPPIEKTVDLWGEHEEGKSAFENEKGDGGKYTNMKTVFRRIFLGIFKQHIGSHFKVTYLKITSPDPLKLWGVNTFCLPGSLYLSSDHKGKIKFSKV